MRNVQHNITISVNNLDVSYSDNELDGVQVQFPEKSVVYENNEKDLNSKILKITMTIQNHYPELSKYLDEMPVTIPTEKNPKMTLKILSQYYESLNSMLNKYLLEHPHNLKV
jgi:hypothetical protein